MTSRNRGIKEHLDHFFACSEWLLGFSHSCECGTKNDGYEEIIRRAWTHLVMGVPMFCISEKSKAVPVALLKWNQVTFKSCLIVVEEVLWLKDGNHNSKFFYQSANARKAKNRIVKLQDDQGR
ncbi:hypothetical protein D8674_000411 [Pyrus ussuriensis x Pyrus communis]|uniref:Uncharacterized protein n=1 Tax=Pyrus ussuriensis x Pyrus communis TaxID=2448454 RepID=A0A5N5F5X7_9ROSA|nr:hypothetical protein D8674_000411 [Pyrus ussuriensis x Pyrus communis]